MAEVLVTGGAGFIGSVLVRRLAERGDDVTVFESVPPEDAWRLAPVLDGIRYVTGDIRDASAPAGVAGAELVFHLSSNTENRGDRAAALADFEVTAGGTVALLQALAAAPPRAFVLASSQLVYGPVTGPVTEQTCPAGPVSRFGAGKLAAEAFLSAYAAELGMAGAACRLSNIIGPGMRRGIIHDLFRQLLEGGRSIKVLGDGRQTRSYLHVEDCVTAMLRAAEAARPGFEVYNVCNADATSAREVAEILAAAWPGDPVPLEFAGGENGWRGDVGTVDVRPERLSALGWRPDHDSAAAVRRTVSELIAAEAVHA